MKPSEFFEKYLPYAQGVQDKYGVPVSVTLSQAAIESSWGESGLTDRALNFFGIKSHNWGGPVYAAATKEEINGKLVPQSALFRKYGTVAEGFDDYGKFLTENPRYADAFKTTNGYDFGAAVAKAGYATGSHYTDMMKSIIKSNNLTQYDNKKSGIDLVFLNDKEKQFMEDLKKKYDSGQMTPEERKEYEEKMEDMLGGTLDPDTWKNGYNNLTEAFSMEKIVRIVIIILVVVVLIVAVFMTIKSSAVKSVGGAISEKI